MTCFAVPCVATGALRALPALGASEPLKEMSRQTGAEKAKELSPGPQRPIVEPDMRVRIFADQFIETFLFVHVFFLGWATTVSEGGRLAEFVWSWRREDMAA